MDFIKRYEKLNSAQKLAVDTIDGPVMVIAGPGTGKTELLSVRVANILRKTDTLPENILCLTYTDSGASAMRERLTDIIGKEAYKVAIHTFHSFGTEVINQNREYFYRGANLKAADNLSRYEIMRKIFEQLDHNNPLSNKLNDEYTYLSDSLTAISEIKKSSLISDELIKILDDNNIAIEKTEQLLSPIFAERISKTTALKLTEYIYEIKNTPCEILLPNITPLSHVIADTLTAATDEAITSNSTKPITAWRNKWFKKDNSGSFILKSHERQVKLRAICSIYDQYLMKMQEASLYDFDDMILQVVHAMEIFNDLRFNLQEKYQYIMVDEFQDTNMAQMRILHNLTNNEAHGDTPNIMVVGDDDQAIYSFQGADISNILDFKTNYPKLSTITLVDNYRSTKDILEGSRDIILQGNDRLENRFSEINKELTPNSIFDSKTIIHEAANINDERQWIVQNILADIKSGKKPSEIAVLTRRHHEIDSLLPYFYKAGINISYERCDNVLDQPPIIAIERIARLLIDIADNRHDEVNAKLPEVLAGKVWGIAPIDLWKLSLKAYDSHSRWLDIMLITPTFIPIHNWLINTASLINDTPLEQILDIIVGKIDTNSDDENDNFVSPLYEHFFSSSEMAKDPELYLTYLESLRAIRSKLRDYHSEQTPNLRTFIEFIDLNRKIGSTISITKQVNQSDNSVNIMTAHKSKGLEFDIVYVMNAVDSAWGERSRGRSSLISFPENLNLSPAGESSDERLRLFYVAITRAKKQLHISYSLSDSKGKKTQRAAFLVNSKWNTELISSPENIQQLTEAAELAWYQPIIKPTTSNMRQLLLPTLENYKLSVTHLHNFLDVTRGGPDAFLLNNLLRFPSAKIPSAAFGTAIHGTLQHTHAHLAATGKFQAVEDVMANFESILKDQHLNERDFEKYSQKGSDALQIFLDSKYSTFTTTQQTELNFANQHSIVGEAHLSGKLDLVDINKANRIITVTDYKTGKPPYSWNGKTDYEKIKLHKYKQQLLFYKLLSENSRDYHNYMVASGIMQFVEPDQSGNIVTLDMSFNAEELEYFTKLINVVWRKIINLELPDTSDYEQSYKGILKFEQDLLDEIV